MCANGAKSIKYLDGCRLALKLFHRFKNFALRFKSCLQSGAEGSDHFKSINHRPILPSKSLP